MQEICAAFWNGQCGCFNEDYPDNSPINCDDEGLCSDEYDENCEDYEPADTHCGNCGKTYENCDCED